jgi:tRNA-Thr(GGU) m(6)t(6)A37 methyltransferase TsaA
MDMINYRPIGIIHSPFTAPAGTPIQPGAAAGVEGTVDIFPEYTAALDDLAEFSHIYLIYHFHLSKTFSLKVTPFLDEHPRGLFATRAPSRPNPIGLSVVRLIGITGLNLTVENIDVVDGTPLLDVKPYVAEFDVHQVERSGWIGQKTRSLEGTVDDGRFSQRHPKKQP